MYFLPTSYQNLRCRLMVVEELENFIQVFISKYQSMRVIDIVFFSPVCTYGASTSFSHFSDHFESCAEHIVRLAETSEIWRGKTSFLSLTGFNDSQLKILDNLNHRAARLVSGAQKYTSCEKLLKDLAWEDTRARIKYLCLCQLYKIMSHMTTSLDHDHHC